MGNLAHTNPNTPSNLYWAKKNGAFYLKDEVSAHGLVLLVQLSWRVAHPYKSCSKNGQNHQFALLPFPFHKKIHFLTLTFFLGPLTWNRPVKREVMWCDYSNFPMLSQILELLRQGLKARNTQIQDISFEEKKPQENMGPFILFFSHNFEKIIF